MAAFAARNARAEAASINPPTQVTRDSYFNWLNAINSNVSPFLDLTFAWYDQQLGSALPPEVDRDPENIHIVVDRARRQTIDLENSGEMAQGNAMGFDSYGKINVPISVALETMLFYCGKPVGQRAGDTYPFNGIFAKCHLSTREHWGPDNYLCTVSMTAGGMAQSLQDEATLLVRGNPTDGYVFFVSFYAPIKDARTPTEAEIFIAMVKSLPDGRTEYRQSVRRNGQSYRFLGLEIGRSQYGFNSGLFRREQKRVCNSMIELQTTGKIRENR